MRLVTAPLFALSIMLTSQLADAQPRGGRRVAPRVQPPRAQPPRAVITDCGPRGDSIESAEQQNENRRAELAGLEAQIDELIEQLSQIQVRRKSLKNAITRTEKSLVTGRAAFKRECSSSQNCGQYDKLVDRLEQRQRPVEGVMNEVRAEITKIRKEVAAMRKKIEPLRSEYKRYACENMVPGGTTQATINKCMSIFSQWNSMQAAVNANNGRIPGLRSRYQQASSQLAANQRKAKGYEDYMTANCKTSKKLATVKKYSTIEDRANAAHNELNALIKEVTSLRGIKITID